MEWASEPGTSKKVIALTGLRKLSQHMKMGAAPGHLKALGHEPSGRVTTAKDGTFRILGALPSQTILLGTESRFGRYGDTYLLPRNVSALSGREDLEPSLIKAAQLKGTLVDGSNCRREAFAEYPDGLRFKLICTHDLEPKIIHNALFPGYVDLTVRDAETGKLLASIPSLLLISGEQTDARLQGLVLE
ncbi:MAG: hypothetical protein GY930_13690 [bacterium]|nr:hypothetical protein [bacterium]